MKTVWWNGTIFTMHKYDDRVEAICTSERAIEEVGTFEQLQPYADRIIDLKGWTVYPLIVELYEDIVSFDDDHFSLSREVIERFECRLVDIAREVAQWNEQYGVTSFTALQQYIVSHVPVEKRVPTRGKIANGHEAHFLMLEEDIFQMSDRDIEEASIGMLVVNGTVVHHRSFDRASKTS